MGYIYRLPDNFKIIDHLVRYHVYISVKKKQELISNEISIYSRNDDGEGIFALGSILSDKIYKTSELSISEKAELYDRSFFQIKTQLFRGSRFPLVDIKYLRQFPSYNKKWCQKPKNPYTLYWDAGLTTDINYIYETYGHLFFPNDNKWRYYIHILRERSINDFKNVRKILKNNKCFNCGILPQCDNFLEIHDTKIINFDNEYIASKKDDYIALCPNCHKILHENIKTGK